MPFRFLLRLTLLTLGLGLFFGAVQAAPLADSIDEAGYWLLVEESQALLESLLDDSQTQDVTVRLESLAARWEQVKRVQVDGGDVVQVDSSAWVAMLRADSPDLEGLHTLFLALQEERQHLSASADVPQGALADLEEILARPEYQWQEQTPSWLQELYDRIWAWLLDLLDQAGPAGEVTTGLGLDILNILAVVVFIGVLAYALRRLFSDLISDADLGASDADEQPLSARLALDRADTFSQTGDYRSAVRYLYLSALLILDERGLLYYDRTKTNREYLRQVAGNLRVAELLREVIVVFDRVWYGFQPVDEALYKHYAARVRELENLK